MRIMIQLFNIDLEDIIVRFIVILLAFKWKYNLQIVISITFILIVAQN